MAIDLKNNLIGEIVFNPDKTKTGKNKFKDYFLGGVYRMKPKLREKLLKYIFKKNFLCKFKKCIKARS